MDKERFEWLVAKAVEGLPEEFRTRLENIDVVLEEYPGAGQLRRAGLGHGQTLLGLYEGVPRTRRGTHYGLVPPDKITIFQRSIEAKCRDDAEITNEIRSVVRHEIAHHFGISDARLQQIEKGENDKNSHRILPRAKEANTPPKQSTEKIINAVLKLFRKSG